jgi:hypothetical protein
MIVSQFNVQEEHIIEHNHAKCHEVTLMAKSLAITITYHGSHNRVSETTTYV